MSLDNPWVGQAGDGIIVEGETISTDEAFAHQWTGEHVFEATSHLSHALPRSTDTYDLGTSTVMWRKAYISEIDAVIFAEQTVSLVGGWFIIGHDEGTVAADVAAVDTTIDFGKAMTVGDFVLFRAVGQVEYVQIGSLVSGTVYNVTRNLDGTGANAWPAGTPYLVLGTTGDGRIELNAYDTPRISIVQQGATYNAQTELARLGDLNANWGYVAETYGIALGEYGAGKTAITVDPTNGIRIRNYATQLAQWDASGNITIGQIGASQSNVYISAGKIALRNNTTEMIVLNADGSASFEGVIDIGAAGGIRVGDDALLLTVNGMVLANDATTATRIRWTNAAGTLKMLEMYGFEETGLSTAYIRTGQSNGYATAYDSKLVLAAQNYNPGPPATERWMNLELYATASDATATFESVDGTVATFARDKTVTFPGVLSVGSYVLVNTGSIITDDHLAAFGGANPIVQITSYDTVDASRGALVLAKSSSLTDGTMAVTSDGEALGAVEFHGVHSGEWFIAGARIAAYQSGAAGGSLVGAYLAFETGTDSVAPTERMRISADGIITIIDGYLKASRTAANLAVFAGDVAGDAERRVVILADGTIQWGTGAVARDTNLYRSAADTLKTDDAFVSASTLTGTQIVSTIAIGTAPLAVTSTTVVGNLNADQLDGNHASAFSLAGHDIVSGHSYSGGAALDLFGLSAASTIAKLTPSADVSAGTAAVLKSDAAGGLALAKLHIGGSSDPGDNNLEVDGYATTADYLVALGGVHVGGTSDPGTDNQIVDGWVNIGTDTAPTTAGQVWASSSGLPTMRATRAGAIESTAATALGIRVLSTSDAVDGAGPALTAYLQDTAAVNNVIGQLAFVRNGADNTGLFVVRPATAGSVIANRLTLDDLGVLNIIGSYQVDGTKVVGNQGTAVADATDAASVILRLNDLLARVRTHGLIAT